VNLNATEQTWRNYENMCSDNRILSKFNIHTVSLESRDNIIYITHIKRAQEKRIFRHRKDEKVISALYYSYIWCVPNSKYKHPDRLEKMVSCITHIYKGLTYLAMAMALRGGFPHAPRPHVVYCTSPPYLLTYLLTEMSPSWGAANCAATQDLYGPIM
jgi:hypothetical protein